MTEKQMTDAISERTLHEARLEELWRKAQAASGSKVVEHPYRLHPTLGVTERERALFNYYRERFLWKGHLKCRGVETDAPGCH